MYVFGNVKLTRLQRKVKLHFKVGKWVLDDRQYKITCDDRSVELTPTSFRLLKLLISNPAKVISITTIKEQVWKTEFTTDNLVYQTIRNLRLALEDSDEQVYIKTIPRFGYQLVAPIEQLSDESEPVATSFNTAYLLIIAVIPLILGVLLWWNLSKSASDDIQPTDMQLLVIKDGIKHANQSNVVEHFEQLLEVEKAKTINEINLFEQLNQQQASTKIVIKFIPENNHVLSMVFVGTPAHLSYVDLKHVNKLDNNEAFTSLFGEIKQSALTRGNSGIATLAASNNELKALVSVSNSASFKEVKSALLLEVESNSLNEDQKRAKYAFIDTLLSFYRLEDHGDEKLLSGINYLVSRYHQSNYALIAAALFIADRGSPNVAFQLVENLEQDLFLTFVQGLLHLEIDESDRALKHFERVFSLAPEFEDNTFFYFLELFESDLSEELSKHSKRLLNSDYFSTSSHFIIFNHYVKHGQFDKAISFLVGLSGKLSCNDDLAGSLALLNASLGNIQDSEQWLQPLNRINHRDWRIPWVVFSNYLFEQKLGEYPMWYTRYQKEVLGSDSLYEPLFLNTLTHYVLGNLESANYTYGLTQHATSAFSRPGTIEIANAVAHTWFDQENPAERVSYLSQFETLARTIKYDETALPNLISALYFTSYDDIKQAENAIINGCKKSPAICTVWRSIPLLKQVVNTAKVNKEVILAGKKMENLQTQQLKALNKTLLPICSAI